MVEVEAHQIETPTPSEPEGRELPPCPLAPGLSGPSSGVMTLDSIPRPKGKRAGNDKTKKEAFMMSFQKDLEKLYGPVGQ